MHRFLADQGPLPGFLRCGGSQITVRLMAYESVDQLQKSLAETVFAYADDKKKAAGRALGTLVEIITYYLLKTQIDVLSKKDWPRIHAA